MLKSISAVLCGLTAVALLWVAGYSTLGATPKKRTGIQMHSSSFKDGGMIPDKYTCGKGNVSPELNWKNVPKGTKSFALVVDDPDASGQPWVHWVIFNIPMKKADITGDTYQLLEGFPRDEKTREGIMQGSNDFKNIGYDGPCPPSGLHQYYFKLYALDSLLNLTAGASKGQLLKAMEKHQLGWTQIMGLYGK
jgi:Raf kinase inhibitor-like YbhB/YbcL family protein